LQSDVAIAFRRSARRARSNGNGSLRSAFRNSTWLVWLWLKIANEPFRWGLRREELGAFLKDRDFALVEVASKSDFLDAEPDGLARYEIAEGEFVGVAEWAQAS
jgi:hypothetical protein